MFILGDKHIIMLMASSGLTDEKMSNKQFYKTERAIFIAYSKIRDYPTAKRLTRAAHISRSTLYRHHPRITHIPRDYEGYLLSAYDKAMRRMIHKKGIKLKITILRMLVFIMNHKEVIKLLLNDGRSAVIKKMLNRIKPRLINEWMIGDDFNKIFSIYTNEIVGIIELWGKHNFSDQYLGTILNDVMTITKTAPSRLSFLIGNKL